MIVYGANCVWWDTIDKAGKTPEHNGISIPCCPHCGSVLFQIEDSKWHDGVAAHDAKNPGYADMIKWSQGKCFQSQYDCIAAYEASKTEGGNNE